MLTRQQIQRLAHRQGIGMQAQERDYIEHLLLSLLYKRTQELAFKGGTALRVVYGSNRYSEDLDFNGLRPVRALKELWSEVADELRAYGVEALIRNEWLPEVGYSFDVSFQGPLYDGRDRSKGKVQVDVNLRDEPVETRRELITAEYDDVRPFVVTVLTREHIFAEKVRALLIRGQPRDLYDIWLLLRQGVHPVRTLIDRKLALYETSFSREALIEALDRVGEDWERDLQPLLPQLVPYGEAWAAVELALANDGQ